MSFKVAVAGCGRHGRSGHVGGFKQIEGVEVVAVCDADFQRAKETAQQFGIPHAYDDHRVMLEKHKLDIVTVATPPRFHKQVAVDAFEAGANVLVEKPLAMNAKEAQEMISACKKAGKLMSMGLQNRQTAAARYLRQFISEGKLGRVYHTRVWAGHLITHGGIPGWGHFHRKELAGGGVLFATTVHALDCAQWVINNPQPVSASGMNHQKILGMKNPPVTWSGRLEDCDIEDFNYGFIRFADGSTMSAESNWLTHPTSRPTGIEILGDYGKASLFPLRIELDEGQDVKDVTPQDLVEPQDHFLEVLKDFVACVRERKVPVVRFSEMLNVQKMMDALYESARLGREVSIA